MDLNYAQIKRLYKKKKRKKTTTCTNKVNVKEYNIVEFFDYPSEH